MPFRPDRSALLALFLLAGLPAMAQDVFDDCSCDLKTARDRQDGGHVINATACIVSYDTPRTWCEYRIESLREDAAPPPEAAALREAAVSGDAGAVVETLTEVFRRYAADPAVVERIGSVFDYDIGALAERAPGLIEGNAELLLFCAIRFVEGATEGLEGGDAIACGVSPDSGWFNLLIGGERIDFRYLLAPG